ncbi:MAG TPA: choice-of-anchor C family protein [Phenylobacterium sp.]|nr:choice-of-anchor C family protein [Phenylobacterium sp.]
MPFGDSLREHEKTLAGGHGCGAGRSAGRWRRERRDLINGSFEEGADPGSFITLGNGSTAITGWTVKGHGVDYIGSYWTAAHGDLSVDLSALKGGTIQQTIDTIVGKTYKVTFWLAGNPDGGQGDKFVATSVSGDQVNSFSFNVGGGNTKQNMGWTQHSYTFKAFDPTATLAFNSQTNTPYGPALDNVSISAVPEPATWAMMIMGFGGVGAAVRASRRKQALAFA